jgi:hypothetical protein
VSAVRERAATNCCRGHGDVAQSGVCFQVITCIRSSISFINLSYAGHQITKPKKSIHIDSGRVSWLSSSPTIVAGFAPANRPSHALNQFVGIRKKCERLIGCCYRFLSFQVDFGYQVNEHFDLWKIFWAVQDFCTACLKLLQQLLDIQAHVKRAVVIEVFLARVVKFPRPSSIAVSKVMETNSNLNQTLVEAS